MDLVTKFKKEKMRLDEAEIKEKLYELMVLRGQYREAKRRNLSEKDYQRTYREQNKLRIRAYHAEYARKRRLKMRQDKNV